MIIEGDFSPPPGRFAIVAARFNSLVVDPLVVGANDALVRHGVKADAIDLVRVPGSFELPLAAKKLAESKKYAAVICLGAVIQGETSHHEYINHQVAAGILQAGMQTGVPVTFGVLTCQTLELALDRAGGKAGNKGVEASLAALEMAHLLRRVSE